MVKVCPVCEKEFDAKGNGKACSADCKLELIKRAQRKYKEKRKLTKRTGRPVGRPKKQKNERPKDQIYLNQANTLCWTCQNATGKCSWSTRLEPVKGWKAEKIKLKVSRGGGGKYVTSYVVKKCPKYIKDSGN